MSDAGRARVMLPADVDILLGRGKPFQNHPGNQRMLTLVDKYRQRYQAAERKEKHDIVEEVMGIISGSGGRFLRRVDYENYWIAVNHAIAYRKVGHAFRSKARKLDGSKNTSPPLRRERVEAPTVNKAGSSMEEILLADLRMRRAALHQADLVNMNNLAAMAASSPLERLLLPAFYNNLAASGFIPAGLMNPSLLAAMGNGAFNNSETTKAPVAPSPQDVPVAPVDIAPVAPAPPLLPATAVP